eukprot:Rhum_TRINITY_DN14962_c0_g1::Rhum_TRINITY_DN14962_c0_g1_i5::g.130542::m.130542
MCVRRFLLHHIFLRAQWVYFISSVVKPGMGHCFANVSTFVFRAAISLEDSSAGRKSTSFLPTLAWMSRQIFTHSSYSCVIVSMSASTMPRVVTAPAPMRMPPGFSADVSVDTVFLFTEIEISSSARSTLAPDRPSGFRFHMSRWLSVPPDTRFQPLFRKHSPIAAMFLRTCDEYALNSGVITSSICVPMAAIWCSCGPPCRPGKTAMSTFSCQPVGAPSFLAFVRKKIIPARGPRSDLCVVVVTTSANLNGDSASFVATRPLMCAMSIIRMAPISSAMRRNSACGHSRGYAEPPYTRIFGRNTLALRSSSSMSR